MYRRHSLFFVATLCLSTSNCGIDHALQTPSFSDDASDASVSDSSVSDTTSTDSDVNDTGVAPVPPPTPTCDATLRYPSGSCAAGLVPVQIWCNDPDEGVDRNWICDSPGAEGDLCVDGTYYVQRQCAEGLNCVDELFVSRCRQNITPCSLNTDCPTGYRCYGFDGDQRVCAPAAGIWASCSMDHGGLEDLQGSCGDGLACMNGDWSGDFAFCLPTLCSQDSDCGDSEYWDARCILEEEAGPGRLPGCAVLVDVGQRCSSGDTPHNAQACPVASVCGPEDSDGVRYCLE